MNKAMSRAISHSIVAALIASTFAGCSDLEEYNTQRFEAGNATCLSGKQLLFGYHQLSRLSKTSAYFHYSRLIADVTVLPIDPTTHEVIDFSEADPFELQLPDDIEVTYYRQRFDTLFIGSDGTIAFGMPGTGSNSFVDAFSSDQLSLLPVDATIEGATVRYAVNQDEIVATYENVDGSTFQCEFILQGESQHGIFVTYLEVSSATRMGVVGLPDPFHPALLEQRELEEFLASPRFTESNLCESSPLDPSGPAYLK